MGDQNSRYSCVWLCKGGRNTICTTFMEAFLQKRCQCIHQNSAVSNDQCIFCPLRISYSLHCSFSISFRYATTSSKRKHKPALLKQASKTPSHFTFSVVILIFNGVSLLFSLHFLPEPLRIDFSVPHAKLPYSTKSNE